MIATLIALGAAIWPFLAAAFACGCLAGLASWSTAPMTFVGRVAVLLAAAALVGGGAASLLEVVAGRPRLWLDLGLLLAAAFLAGGLLGSLLRRPFLRRRAPSG